jgi:hypothetical protein
MNVPINNLPEESIKKEHITGFQQRIKLLGLQPNNFGMNSEDFSSKYHNSPKSIVNK